MKIRNSIVNEKERQEDIKQALKKKKKKKKRKCKNIQKKNCNKKVKKKCNTKKKHRKVSILKNFVLCPIFGKSLNTKTTKKPKK